MAAAKTSFKDRLAAGFKTADQRPGPIGANFQGSEHFAVPSLLIMGFTQSLAFVRPAAAGKRANPLDFLLQTNLSKNDK